MLSLFISAFLVHPEKYEHRCDTYQGLLPSPPSFKLLLGSVSLFLFFSLSPHVFMFVLHHSSGLFSLASCVSAVVGFSPGSMQRSIQGTHAKGIHSSSSSTSSCVRLVQTTQLTTATRRSVLRNDHGMLSPRSSNSEYVSTSPPAPFFPL